MKIGDLVRFRGRFATEFSIRGVIEVLDGERIGVRLENGNFHWCDASQVVVR